MNKPAPREGFVAGDIGEIEDDVAVAPQPSRQQRVEPPPPARPQQTRAQPAARPVTNGGTAPPITGKEIWPVKVKLLYKSIRTEEGELLHELSFREPTGGDINRYGNPIRVNQEGDVIIDERKMMVMMSALTGVFQPFLETMDPRDWNSCAYRLRGFFLPDLSAW